MPIRFRVDTETRCVYVAGEPPVTDQDLADYQRALAAHPDHGPGFDQLADMTAVDGLHVTGDGLRAAGALTETWADHVAGTKLAIVAPAETAFGMARVFSAYVTEGIEVRVFREVDAALGWLGLPDSVQGRLGWAGGGDPGGPRDGPTAQGRG